MSIVHSAVAAAVVVVVVVVDVDDVVVATISLNKKDCYAVLVCLRCSNLFRVDCKI